MAYLIHLETSTRSLSVAVSQNDRLIAEKTTLSGNTHSENITIFIEQAVNEAGIRLSNLDAVSVSKGPGSYMGLRIGTSAAKGLCYALDIPLIAVDTLQAMALKMSHETQALKALYCPMLDARRMEVYCALYDEQNTCIQPTAAIIIDNKSFKIELINNTIIFFGDGAPKCKPVMQENPSALFEDNYLMRAQALIPLSWQRYTEKKFENLAYFEPFYLKDFIPGEPKVKGLR